jgi:predicted branched-subunit amino acid permease
MTWETVMATSWSKLMSGDIVGASISSYTNIMGVWFYLIFLFMTMLMVYMRTQNYVTTALLGIIISGAVLPLMPSSASTIIVVMMCLGSTIILYRAFHK